MPIHSEPTDVTLSTGAGAGLAPRTLLFNENPCAATTLVEAWLTWVVGGRLYCCRHGGGAEPGGAPRADRGWALVPGYPGVGAVAGPVGWWPGRALWPDGRGGRLGGGRGSRPGRGAAGGDGPWRGLRRSGRADHHPVGAVPRAVDQGRRGGSDRERRGRVREGRQRPGQGSGAVRAAGCEVRGHGGVRVREPASAARRPDAGARPDHPDRHRRRRRPGRLPEGPLLHPRPLWDR